MRADLNSGVATVPWRARAAEDSLRGKRLDEDSARQAADVAFADARPRTHNAFKVPMAVNTIVAVLRELTTPETR